MFAIFLALAAPAAVETQAVAEDVREPMVPVTNPGRWVTNDDYPIAAMREEREGTTGFRLTIGADGLPTACEITAASGHADLDSTTCRLVMERGRFAPGRGADGKAAGGTYSNRVRWQIPEGEDGSPNGLGFAIDTAQESWPRGPIPDEAFRRIDPAVHYPATARAAREEGTVHMELAVDAAGRVAGCKVNQSSFSAALDDAACALMRSDGTFSPALDSDGKPVRSVIAATFQWVLPQVGADGVSVPRDTPFPMDKSGSMTVTVVMGADGRISDCRFSASGKFEVIPNGRTPCDSFLPKIRYAPFVDSEGKPVAKLVTMRNELIVEDAPAAANAK